MTGYPKSSVALTPDSQQSGSLWPVVDPA